MGTGGSGARDRAAAAALRASAAAGAARYTGLLAVAVRIAPTYRPGTGGRCSILARRTGAFGAHTRLSLAFTTGPTAVDGWLLGLGATVVRSLDPSGSRGARLAVGFSAGQRRGIGLRLFFSTISFDSCAPLCGSATPGYAGYHGIFSREPGIGPGWPNVASAFRVMPTIE